MTKPATNKFGGHPQHKKVFDIMRPNKSMPGTNSRPTLVTDKPQTDDDQFVPVTRGHSRAVAVSHDEKDDKKLLTKAKKDLPAISPVKVQADDFPPPSAPAVSGGRTKRFQPAADSAPAALEEVTSAEDELLDIDLSSEAEPATVSPPPVTATPQPPAHAEPRPTEPEPDVTPPAAATAGEDDSLLTEPDSTDDTEAAYNAFLTANEKDAKDTIAEKSAEKTNEKTEKSDEPDRAKPIVPDALPREDMMAGAGMTMPVQDEAPRAVISHHKRGLRWWQILIVILMILLLGLTAFNFVLDAELLTPNFDIPHTNLL